MSLKQLKSKIMIKSNLGEVIQVVDPASGTSKNLCNKLILDSPEDNPIIELEIIRDKKPCQDNTGSVKIYNYSQQDIVVSDAVLERIITIPPENFEIFAGNPKITVIIVNGNDIADFRISDFNHCFITKCQYIKIVRITVALAS